MDLMYPTYGLYGFSYFWPAWVHLIVVALMVVSGGLVLRHSLRMQRGEAASMDWAAVSSPVLATCA